MAEIFGAVFRFDYPILNRMTGYEALVKLQIVLQIPVYMNGKTQLSHQSSLMVEILE